VSLFGARRHPRTAALPVEGHLPGFDGATGWLNSSPLTPAELRGRVVLVDFWTYTWAVSTGRCESWSEGIRMPRYAPNKMPTAVKRRYFELIRTGLSGSAAAQEVGVSLSCGSLWFIDAGRVSFLETPISPCYLSQDDRIEIADGLARGEPVKLIAARIGKTFQSVYREIARNRKSDGRYQPWYAHNRAYQRRRRPKPRRFSVDAELAETVAGRLAKRWSPAQISRWLRRRYRRRRSWHVCAETIYEAVYRGLIVPVDRQSLRTDAPIGTAVAEAEPAMVRSNSPPPGSRSTSGRPRWPRGGRPGTVLRRVTCWSAPDSARRSQPWSSASSGSRCWFRCREIIRRGRSVTHSSARSPNSQAGCGGR
jgi:hypothetical protein